MKEIMFFSSIILAFSLLIILLVNYKLRNKIIKFLFLVYSLLFLILILIFDNEYVIELLTNIITFIWYPNYLIFGGIIIFSIVNLVYYELKQTKFIKAIMNYLLFMISFLNYLVFKILEIDVTSKLSLYSNTSLIILRTTSISFIIFIISNILIKFIGGLHEK